MERGWSSGRRSTETEGRVKWRTTSLPVWTACKSLIFCATMGLRSRGSLGEAQPVRKADSKDKAASKRKGLEGGCTFPPGCHDSALIPFSIFTFVTKCSGSNPDLLRYRQAASERRKHRALPSSSSFLGLRKKYPRELFPVLYAGVAPRCFRFARSPSLQIAQRLRPHRPRKKA